MDRTDSMIRQHLYWPDIRDSVQKDVSNCDTCQCTKLSNKQKYGKLIAKLAEEISWNKLCVDIIVTCDIQLKGKKEKLYLKSVTMINSVTG